MNNTIETIIKDIEYLEAAIFNVRDILIEILEECERGNKNHVSTKAWELARLECIHARGQGYLVESEESIRDGNLKSLTAFIEVTDSLSKEE